jgi:hypothetical protein
MAVIRNPRKFTDQFGVPLERFRESGLLDPVLNADTQLFIDPLLLERSDNPIIRERGAAKFKKRFTDVYRLLHIRPRTEVVEAALDRLLQFPEIAGTCLGYTAGGVGGHGMGPEKRARFMHVAAQVEEVGRVDPRLIPVLAILESGIGADLISDMTANIIVEELAEITTAFCTANGIPTERFMVGGVEHLLPRNPMINKRSSPIVLVPTDILRDLPEADNWEDVIKLTVHNAQLRARVNHYIAEIMEDEELYAHEKRERAAEELKETSEAVARVGEFFANQIPVVYDIINDPGTKRLFQRIIGIVEHEFPIGGGLRRPETEAEFRQLIGRVVEQFRFLVEHKAIWKLLWITEGRRVHETIAQQIFFAIAHSYCEGYDVHIAVEHHTGDGRTDFLFTLGRQFRVVVELKWSDNAGLERGYTKQVEAYAMAEHAFHSFYVVLDCDGGDSFAAFQAYLDGEGLRRPAITIVSVDANPKGSPSKPPL